LSKHVYTVEFRIFGATIDPLEITKGLDLHPCQVRVNGSRRGKTVTAMWAYNGFNDGSNHEWDSLEEGLQHVLNALWPKKDMISKYAENAELIWWCGHFQSAFDGGPELSPGLLSRLGEFGATLYIDNYFHGETA